MQQYILKLSIALAVVYLFYWVLLRRLTFYNWNRWYLLLYPAACFLIPFINIGDLLQRHGLQDAPMVSYIPVIVVTGGEATPVQQAISWGVLTLLLIMAGSVLMLGRLLLQYLSLRRLLSSAVLLSDGVVRLFHIDKKIIPFSTGNAIYINRHLHADNELREIIRHEFIHIKQRHSIDLWWTEVLCMLNWFNPFAWLIRKAIRQNLEYIADHQVLQSGLDRKQYQLLLLKVTGVAPFSFTSHFNFSSLKKRIVMMNKNKTAQVHLVRFLFIVPLLAVVLLAFRNVSFNNAPVAIVTNDTLPKKSKTIEEAFKEKGIRYIHIKEDGKTARVTLADGTTKTYDLTKSDVKAAFEKEYGELATPPLPPTPPVIIRDAVAPQPPAPVKGVHPPAPPAPPVLIKEAVTPPPAPGKNGATPPPPPKPPVVVQDVAITGKGQVIEVTNVRVALPKATGESIQARASVQDVAVTGTGSVTEQPASASQLVNKVLAARKADGSQAVRPGEVKEVIITGQPAKTQVTGTAIVADVVEVRNVLPKLEQVTISGRVLEIQPDATSRDAFGAMSAHPLVEIKSTATREQLDEIIQTLNKKGYSMEWKNMVFKDGLLVSIDGVIGYGDSREMFSVESFSSIGIYTYEAHPEKYFIKVANGRVSFHQKLNY
ncbi:M56 family metallopeptidase [Paraflavitalea pollutisoli]|uniref:M56 family metallopeptidase n=1 Tax=Paraflavitalea pollutisoli TaxID=3034143 RepID=UPI0023EBECBB|nr:M56 family metallopeptidase [Paraflavitalea sp. H1-2-19X]